MKTPYEKFFTRITLVINSNINKEIEYKAVWDINPKKKNYVKV